MNPVDEDHVIAFISKPDGTIIRIIRDDLGLSARLPAGVSILNIMDGASTAKAVDFLGALNERQAACRWELSIIADDQPTQMQFAGMAQAEHLYIVAAPSGSGPDITQELSAINIEQTNALRSVIKELNAYDLARHQRDRHLYDELSRLKNQLAHLEREIANKNVQLEQLNEQRSRVIEMAAHDLRSPLSVIGSYSEFLETEAGDMLNAEQLELVAEIRSSSEFMLRMVTDILDVTAIEASQLRLNRQPTDPARLIQHTATLNRVLAGRKGIETELDPIPALPPVEVDASKIKQVLNTLVSNAVKSSRRGSVVRLHVTGSNESVTVAVADQGQGIPATDLPMLFQPFSKGSPDGEGDEAHSGLGLAIVRNIVEGHGGRIWLESAIGKGSTVLFTLPIA